MGKNKLTPKHIKLTDEEMSILSKYSDKFENVLKYNTIRGISKNTSIEISSIIDKDKKRHYNWGCSGCIIGLYRRAANIYNYNLELRAAEEAEKLPVISDDAEEQKNEDLKDDEGTKKRTRAKASKKQEPEIQGEA